MPLSCAGHLELVDGALLGLGFTGAASCHFTMSGRGTTTTSLPAFGLYFANIFPEQEKRYIEVEQRDKAGSVFVPRDLYFNDCRVVHLGSGTNPLLCAAGRMSLSRDHLCLNVPKGSCCLGREFCEINFVCSPPKIVGFNFLVIFVLRRTRRVSARHTNQIQHCMRCVSTSEMRKRSHKQARGIHFKASQLAIKCGRLKLHVLA